MDSRAWLFSFALISSLQGSIAQAETAKPEITVNGFLDGYYSFNFNNPKQTTGLSASGVSSSAVPSANNTYRYYDTYQNQFILSLAELTIKATLKEVSFVADLDFGPFADLNASAPTPAGTVVDESSKHIGQAVLSYRPTDSNFSFDAGKMYSHLGVETVKSKDNFNYSRSILFSYAIPFWHTGFRVGYDAIPGKIQTSLYIYNGWNVQYDTNRSKTLGGQVKFTPSSETTLIYNFLGGPERTDSESDWKTIHEISLTQSLSESSILIANIVHGSEENAVVSSSRTRAQWHGGFVGWKYQINDHSYLSPRYEVYRDKDGYNLGAASQTINSLTLTYSRSLAQGFETRVEARSDSSSESTFTSDSGTSKSQTTLLVAGLFSF